MGPNFFSNSNYTPNSYSGTSYGTSGGSLGQRLKSLSKNTKILIIVAIAAVILISLFAIIGGVNSSKKTSAGTDTITALNRYANWILYGEDSDANFTDNEYDETNLYSVEKEYFLGEISSKKAFIEKATELYEKFIEKYNEDFKDGDYFESSMAWANRDRLDFLYLYTDFTDLDGDIIYDQLIRNSFDATEEYIKKYYSVFENDSSSISQQYYEEATGYWSVQLEIMQIYVDNNCADGNNCSFDETTQNMINELSDSLEEYDENFVDSEMNLLIKQCWYIMEGLESEKE